jgi:hypothetical protein
MKGYRNDSSIGRHKSPVALSYYEVSRLVGLFVVDMEGCSFFCRFYGDGGLIKRPLIGMTGWEPVSAY